MNEHRIKWHLKILRLFCNPEYLEEIEGELLEFYHKKPSRWLLSLEILKLLRPVLIKKLEGGRRLNYFGLLKNQLVSSARFIRREKAYTLMNVTGLSVGMACCMFIFLWLSDELQYNSHLDSGERVCNVLNSEVQSNGDINTYRYSAIPLKAVLDNHYPIIEATTVLSNGNWMAFEVGQDLIEWAGVDATPEVFDIFEITFLKGGFEKLFDNPNTLVISEDLAEVYFGKEWEHKNIVGTLMENDEQETFELVGVYENQPEHATVHFEFVVPFENRIKKRPNLKSWNNSSSQLFVRLKKDVEVADANQILKDVVNQHHVGEFQNSREIFLQPYEDMYLYNRYENGKITGGRIVYIRLLSISVILVLLLASINFMNLATAQAIKRGKETGIRKVLGAAKKDIKIQFQVESILMTLLSAGLAGIIVLSLFPVFESLTNKDFSVIKFSWESIAGIMLFVLSLGFVTGIYPSFYLSSLKSISLLKSANSKTQRKNGLRKTLVVFQFSITLVMIIGSLTVYQQVSYIQNKNIGLDRSNLLRTFSYDMNPVRDYQTYKTDLLSKPGIESVTMVNQLLIDVRNTTSSIEWEGKTNTDELEFYHMQANPDFIPTMKIELSEGRNFDWQIQSDTNQYIINEAAVKLMGLTDPIGKPLTFWNQKGRIIGVVKDFHNASLHSEIKPLIIRNQMSSSWMILVRTKPGMKREAIASLEETFLAFNPNRSFWFRFLDDMYNAKYKSELLVRELSLYFTIVSVAISLLGLISMVAYSIERRTKEIGIRKVLGASVFNILQLLSADYIRLIIFAIFIAFPVSYYIMSNWLKGYAYRIGLDWWIFILSGTGTVILSMLIIVFLTKKVAISNPVNSLKDE